MNLPQPGDRFDRKASAARNKGGGDNHRRPPHGSDDRARCNRPGDAWRLLSNSWIFFSTAFDSEKGGGKQCWFRFPQKGYGFANIIAFKCGFFKMELVYSGVEVSFWIATQDDRKIFLLM